MNINTNDTDTLEIRWTYQATREKVFNALTRADIMAKWLNAGADGKAEVESDCKVGGAYSVRMFDGGGELVSHTVGEYLLVDPPKRLSCTWVTKGFVEHSVLSFELFDVDGGVELVLRHELPIELVEPHSQGWPNCLERLEEALAS